LNASEYDVLFFQEAFSGTVQDMLTAALRANYPYIIAVAIPATGIKLGSGIFIASRVPLKWCKTIKYSGCGSDKLANKGCVSVGLDLGGGVIVACFSSHTQSNKLRDPLWWFTSNETAIACRRKQLKDIGEFVKACNEEHKPSASLILGDLNYTGEYIESRVGAGGISDKFSLTPTEEYLEVADVFKNVGINAIDTFREKYPLKEGMSYEEAGLTCDSAVNCDNSGESKRLDYCYLINASDKEPTLAVEECGMNLFEFDNEPERDRERRVARGDLRKKYLSDHSALEITFSVKAANAI